MIWAGISLRRVTPLLFVSNNLDSVAYCHMLGDNFLPWVEEVYPNESIFQQDGASPQKSNSTKEYLFNQGVKYIDWPASSPDMNSIENRWGILSAAV